MNDWETVILLLGLRGSYKQHPCHRGVCSSHGRLMFSKNFFSKSLSAWPALTGFHNAEKQGYWPIFSLSLFDDEITQKTFLQQLCPKSHVQHWNTPSNNGFEACIEALGTQTVWRMQLNRLTQAAAERQGELCVFGRWQSQEKQLEKPQERPLQHCCNLERISLLCKNSYVISLDLLESEAF